MIFCQACGGENSDDARFCNKCGSQIARPGESGGPLPPAPASNATGSAPAGNTLGGGTVTLAGIGITSPRKTYGILGGGAVLFLALGAGLAWVAMRTGPAPAAETDGTREDEGEVEIGDAIPEGVDVPGGEFVTSGPRVVRPGSSGATPTTPATPGTSGATPSTTTPSTTTPSTTTPSTTTPSTTTPSTRPTRPTTPSTRPTTPSTPGTTTPTSPTSPGTTTPTSPGTTTPTSPSTTTPSTTPTTPRDWDALEEGVGGDEPDYEMEHYATTVRRFIRTYYLTRATSCFEHESATRRDPVRGTVVIGFQIALHGDTEHVTIDRNTTGADTLATCLRNQVEAWQLPSPPPDEAPLPMQMPFSR